MSTVRSLFVTLPVTSYLDLGLDIKDKFVYRSALKGIEIKAGEEPTDKIEATGEIKPGSTGEMSLFFENDISIPIEELRVIQWIVLQSELVPELCRIKNNPENIRDTVIDLDDLISGLGTVC